MLNATVNWFAVVVSTIVSMMIGYWWFSMNGFGKQYLKLNKITMKEIKAAKNKSMAGQMIAAFISTGVMAYILALFVSEIGVTSFVSGLQLGFWVWLGFFATTQLGMVLWEKKPFKLYVITTGHYLVSTAIMAGILAIWP